MLTPERACAPPDASGAKSRTALADVNEELPGFGTSREMTSHF
jgi:hypothetical protein